MVPFKCSVIINFKRFDNSFSNESIHSIFTLLRNTVISFFQLKCFKRFIKFMFILTNSIISFICQTKLRKRMYNIGNNVRQSAG